MRPAWVLLLLLLPATARAQSGFTLQTLRPAVDTKGFVTVDGSDVVGHLDFSLGLVTSYAHDVLRLDGGGRAFAVEHLLTPQLQAALGLWRVLEVGVSLPVDIISGTRAPASLPHDALSFGGGAVGDLGLHVKARLVDGHRHALGLGALVSVYAPTGNSATLGGDGQVTLRPELIVDKDFGRMRIGLDAGALIRPATHTFTDDATGLSRALGTQLTYGVAVSGALVPRRLELIGEAFGYIDPAHATGNPLEALAAFKVYLAESSYFEIGGGAGVLPASVAGGMTGSPGVRVFVGIVFEPRMGGSDGDAMHETPPPIAPPSPAPAPPPTPPVAAPPSDRDKDGLADEDDLCPDEPGPVENNGCPLPPPREPPHPRTSRVRGGKIIFMKPIMFETGKAIIKSESFPTLDDVADTLRGNPQLLVVEVQGHADERADDDYNLQLTEARAAAVKAYLVAKGVEDDRLAAHGYGETRPVCRAHNEECWSRNRRVEFVILRRSDGL